MIKVDEGQLKQIGTYILLIVGAFGIVLLETLDGLDWSTIWVTFAGITYYAIDAYIGAWIWHFFKVKKAGTREYKNIIIETGILILIILGAFGTVFLEHIALLGWSVKWVTFIGIVWYATEALISGLIIHYFKIPVEDVPEPTNVPENVPVILSETPTVENIE